MKCNCNKKIDVSPWYVLWGNATEGSLQRQALDDYYGQARLLEVYERALRELAECDLSEDFCASFDVANKRIRSIARAALAKGKSRARD